VNIVFVGYEPSLVDQSSFLVAPALRGRSPVSREYAHVDRFGPGTKRSDQ
jgi:hypothetical protein